MSTRSYLQDHARPLDLRRYQHLFEGADHRPVLDELAAFQNADGGFGRGLEPDLRLPDSSVLATIVAFQHLAELGGSDPDLVGRAVGYLVGAHDPALNGWINIPPAADRFPRAPWWDHATIQTWAGWGNPSAEVLGYLLEHADLVDDALLQRLSEQAVRRLHEIGDPERHEIKCFVRLYVRAPDALRSRLREPLAGHIKRATTTDPAEWEGYVATPLTFITAPDAPFADLFDRELLQANAVALREQMVDGTYWEPTWEWGQFPDEWARARVELIGKLTVDHLRLLRAFGVTE
jgi:hypothetical protein